MAERTKSTLQQIGQLILVVVSAETTVLWLEGLGRKNRVNTPATDRPANTSISRNNSIMAGGLGRNNKVNTPATDRPANIQQKQQYYGWGFRQKEQTIDRPANTGISKNNSIMAGGLGRKNKVNTPARESQLILVSAETTVLWLGV